MLADSLTIVVERELQESNWRVHASVEFVDDIPLFLLLEFGQGEVAKGWRDIIVTIFG
jgi:hypothetical protein